MRADISNVRRAVCTIANEYIKQGCNRSEAFIKAWIVTKNNITLRVSGVTFDNRQAALAYLAKFRPSDLQTVLKRDPNNQYDRNAVKVIVKVPEIKKQAVIGYIPATLSGGVSKLLDKGLRLKTQPLGVIGGYADKENYGFLLKLAI